MRVLLIDDRSPILCLLERYLESFFGPEIDLRECITCDAGLACLASDPPFDLVITDFDTPGMSNGINVAQAANQRDIPVVLHSGHASELIQRQLNATGAKIDGFLEKPFRAEEFIQCLTDLGFKPVTRPT